MASFRRQLTACIFTPRHFDCKVRRFCWPKGTSLECMESIYVKTTEAACVSDKLCHLKRLTHNDSRMGPCSYFKHEQAFRVVVLEYSQLHKKPYYLFVYEFGAFENVLRDTGIRTIPLPTFYSRGSSAQDFWYSCIKVSHTFKNLPCLLPALYDMIRAHRG